MFVDPWSHEMKVSVASDVPEPRRLELEHAFIRFESAGDRVEWSPTQFTHTPYLKAGENFYLVFPTDSIHIDNVRNLNATLYIKYAEESSGKYRSRYATIRCESGPAVQLDPKHTAPIWRLKRAGLVSWMRRGFAAFTG